MLTLTLPEQLHCISKVPSHYHVLIQHEGPLLLVHDFGSALSMQQSMHLCCWQEHSILSVLHRSCATVRWS